MTPTSRLTSKRDFNAPSPEPSQRFSQPSETASIAFVSSEATSVKTSGTAIQIAMNASTCATVIESVTLENTFSATEAYKAFAASKPTISPSKVASCFTNPFMKPITAPAPIITNITMSITAIYDIKKARITQINTVFLLTNP